MQAILITLLLCFAAAIAGPNNAYAAASLEDPVGSVVGGSKVALNFSKAVLQASFTAPQNGSYYKSIKPNIEGIIKIDGRFEWRSDCVGKGSVGLSLRNKSSFRHLHGSHLALYSANWIWYVSGIDRAEADAEYEILAWYGDSNCTATAVRGYILFQQALKY